MSNGIWFGSSQVLSGQLAQGVVPYVSLDPRGIASPLEDITTLAQNARGRGRVTQRYPRLGSRRLKSA